MDINPDLTRNRILDVKRDLITLMVNTSLCEEDEGLELSIWSAKVIKNIAHFISIVSVLLTQLEIQKDCLLAALQVHMEENGISKNETDDLTIKLVKNPPRVVINDLLKIDKYYYYEKLYLDKNLISKQLKDGVPVLGCKLVQDNRVDIKYKSIKAKECV